MKIFKFIFKKIYWLAVLLIPLLPAYIYSTLPETRNCSANGLCFQTGSVYINSEAVSIVYLSFALLLPLCLWELVGKSIADRMQLFRLNHEKSRSSLFKFSSQMYFLMIALIPLLFWYMFGTFFAPYDCAMKRNCFQFYMPLSNESRIGVLISCLMLWPVCILKLNAIRTGRPL